MHMLELSGAGAIGWMAILLVGSVTALALLHVLLVLLWLLLVLIALVPVKRECQILTSICLRLANRLPLLQHRVSAIRFVLLSIHITKGRIHHLLSMLRKVLA